MNESERTEFNSAVRYFLNEFDAYWRSEHVKHPNAEAFAYLRTARNQVAEFFPDPPQPIHDGRSGYEIIMARKRETQTQ